MDERFSAYAVIWEVLPNKVEELAMHFIVIFKDDSFSDADKSTM